MKRGLLFIFILIAYSSCKEKVTRSVSFPFFLDEKCMIVNVEQDNSIEGECLRVQEKTGSDALILNLPPDFFVSEKKCDQFVVGWGSDKPLYDAGVENLRKIKSIDLQSKKCVLGELLRGEGFPKKDQRIVFWNINPSGFKKAQDEPIINPEQIKDFHGKSIGFGSVVFDSISSKWIMFVNEVDTDFIQTYVLASSDLKTWSQLNNNEPIFKANYFKNTLWAGMNEKGNATQSVVISDVVNYNGKWYFFADGFDKAGKRSIGLITSDHLLGPYKISEKPILNCGADGSWNDKSSFCSKVIRYKDHFVMFYDGRNRKGEEEIGLATSDDLVNWKDYEKNPVISQHEGWRSSFRTTEPSYVEVHGDSIFLLVAGAKEFKMGWWHHYITGRMYLDKSGNVGDAQLGVFLSVDGGKTFVQHSANPVFVNNYADAFENEHMGGNFRLIKTDSLDYIVYQGKSSYEGAKYNILLRTRRK